MIKPTGISKKLKYIGVLLSVIILMIIILNVIMNDKSKKDSLVINIAGKQRMLTQKMSKEIFYIKQKDSADFRELSSAVDMFGENLNDLLEGNEVKGIYAPQTKEIKNKLQEVKEIWIPFKASISTLKKYIFKVKPDIESLIQKNTYLLNLSDDIVKAMVKNDMEGVYIDFSGRQRMLSQRMGLFMERYLRTDNKDDFLKFETAKNLYEKTLQRFLKDTKVQNIPDVNLSVQTCYNYWKDYNAYLSDLIKIERVINDNLSYIYEKNIKLLNTMDTAVWLYTDYSETKKHLFDQFQYIALVIVLIIILYMYILSKEIVTHVNDFVKQAKALEDMDLESLSKTEIIVDDESEDELKVASTHISNFVQKVNSAMNHSQDAISKAEAAVAELQYLADDVENALEELNVDEDEKNSIDKKVNATEDIAIESAENLLYVKKMLEKLQQNLNTLVEKSQNNK